jgi:hypothetical protein
MEDINARNTPPTTREIIDMVIAVIEEQQGGDE